MPLNKASNLIMKYPRANVIIKAVKTPPKAVFILFVPLILKVGTVQSRIGIYL